MAGLLRAVDPLHQLGGRSGSGLFHESWRATANEVMRSLLGPRFQVYRRPPLCSWARRHFWMRKRARGTEPAAFLSYARSDDEHEEGRVTELRKRLEGEIRMYTGQAGFTIFQDRRDIRWGEQWRQRIDGVLDATTFLIPVMSPLFFTSNACRDELTRFMEREKARGRGDLILPIYYVDSRAFAGAKRRR